MTLRLLPILVVLAVVGAALPVRAEDDGSPGLAYASLFTPIPAGTPINVRPWDNSAENQRVQESLTDALTQQGVALTGKGTPLTLNFETKVESLAVPGVGPSLGQVQGRNYDSRIRMNLWSNSEDSVLAGRRSNDDSATTRYILRATLDDQTTGERLWQGEAHYTAVVTDETKTFVAMAPILLSGFGKNLHPKSFRLQ
jgi:hypothetical protein